MIRAITFDLDGVYFPDGKIRFLESIVKLGVPENEAKRVFLKSDQMNRQYKNGAMTDDEFWSWAANEWKLDLETKDFTKLLVDSYSVSQEVSEIVRAVRKLGYKTLICSNNFPARVNGLRQRFNFLDDFDAAIFSYEVGASKPSEKIFAELIERSDVSPEAIFFADDNPDNLAGAKSLGITTFLYDGFDKFLEQLKGLGVKI